MKTWKKLDFFSFESCVLEIMLSKRDVNRSHQISNKLIPSKNQKRSNRRKFSWRKPHRYPVHVLAWDSPILFSSFYCDLECPERFNSNRRSTSELGQSESARTSDGSISFPRWSGGRREGWWCGICLTFNSHSKDISVPTKSRQLFRTFQTWINVLL